MLVAERAARRVAESEARYRALLIEKLKYAIRNLQLERFGRSSERGASLEQLELQLADLERMPRKPRRRGWRPPRLM
jgi:transposase